MSLESNAAYQGLDRCFCIRMKSTLTKRGCHFKSSGYRVTVNVPVQFKKMLNDIVKGCHGAVSLEAAQSTILVAKIEHFKLPTDSFTGYDSNGHCSSAAYGARSPSGA